MTIFSIEHVRKFYKNIHFSIFDYFSHAELIEKSCKTIASILMLRKCSVLLIPLLLNQMLNYFPLFSNCRRSVKQTMERIRDDHYRIALNTKQKDAYGVQATRTVRAMLINRNNCRHPYVLDFFEHFDKTFETSPRYSPKPISVCSNGFVNMPELNEDPLVSEHPERPATSLIKMASGSLGKMLPKASSMQNALKIAQYIPVMVQSQLANHFKKKFGI